MNLCLALGLQPHKCRLVGAFRPTSPTYPLFPGDPATWETEAVSGEQGLPEAA